MAGRPVRLVRPRLTKRATRMRDYLRSVGMPVSVRAAIVGAGLSQRDGFHALAELLERAAVTMRHHPELGETVQAVGQWRGR